MSKKDRLKKQSLKQIEEKKNAAREEEKERLEAGESRSAKKLRRSAKKHSGALTLIMKLLMCPPFIWSGICYNVIFLVGISMDEVSNVPKRMAFYLGGGARVCVSFKVCHTVCADIHGQYAVSARSKIHRRKSAGSHHRRTRTYRKPAGACLKMAAGILSHTCYDRSLGSSSGNVSRQKA